MERAFGAGCGRYLRPSTARCGCWVLNLDPKAKQIVLHPAPPIRIIDITQTGREKGSDMTPSTPKLLLNSRSISRQPSALKNINVPPQRSPVYGPQQLSLKPRLYSLEVGGLHTVEIHQSSVMSWVDHDLPMPQFLHLHNRSRSSTHLVEH